MKAKWEISSRHLAGLPCVELDVNKEWSCPLNKGEIYEYSADRYGVVVYDWRAANKLIKQLGLKKKPRRPDEELMFSFPKNEAQLAMVIEVLGRPPARKSPLEIITEFSSNSQKFGPSRPQK